MHPLHLSKPDNKIGRESSLGTLKPGRDCGFYETYLIKF